MENWTKIKLEDVCNIKKGEQLNKLDLESTGDYPCINGGILPSGYADKWNTEANTITISEGGNSCGYVNILKTRFWSGGHCYSLLQIKNIIHNEYLYFALKGREKLIMDLRVGSGLPNIQQKAIKNFEFIYPNNKTEQQKIAEILAKTNQAIAETEALIAKYKRIKTGLMQDLLTKGIDEKGNIRSEATHEFKDSPLGRIPKEWEVVKLGEIISKGNGRIQTGPFGSQLHANEYVNEGTPVIMPQNIKYNKIETAGIAKIKQEKVNQMERHIVEKEDIIFARRGDLSKCSVINNENEGWICGTGCLLIRPPKQLINSEWLSIMYQQDLCQIQIDISATGSTMQNLNTKLLSDLLVFQLNKREQDRIIAYINRQTIIIDKQIRSYSKLQRLKTGLMQDLLSGKVRVNPLIQETSCN